MRLYYYSRGARNFGDELGPVVVAALAGASIPVVNGASENAATPSAGGHLLALGSILHLAGPRDVVWGSGINPTRLPEFAGLRLTGKRWRQQRLFRSLSFRAVRGPLTARLLTQRFGIETPRVFGDPALLLPRLVPGVRAPVRRYGVIPHYRDAESFTGQAHVTSVLAPWRETLAFILGCELVIASSLHALIVAEAYGVPARWLRHEDLPSTRTEAAFKYNDYYASTGRAPDQHAPTIERALTAGGLPPISGFDAAALDAAFPRECFAVTPAANPER